jgi:hypothetical protein
MDIDHIARGMMPRLQAWIFGRKGQTMSELRRDIEAAKQRMSVKLGSNREIKKFPEYLWESEAVELMASGYYGGGTGLGSV